MKNIIEQYIGTVLLLATIAAVLYVFRDKILKAITGASVEEFKEDLATIKDTDYISLASDIYKSITTTDIAPAQFRTNISAIDAALIAKGIQPRRLTLIAQQGGI